MPPEAIDAPENTLVADNAARGYFQWRTATKTPKPDADDDTGQPELADEVEIPEAILRALVTPNLPDPNEGDYD